MIHIFAEQTKDNNIILFRDSITKDFRTINYKNINISKKNSYDSPVEYPITYIVKYSIYYSNDEKKTDIKLISYPNNKAFFSISINTENENLIFNKEEYYYEESCPYTKLYLEIKKSSKSKYKLLGYINYKTHEFMKNKPKDSGCKSQPLSWD